MKRYILNRFLKKENRQFDRTPLLKPFSALKRILLFANIDRQQEVEQLQQKMRESGTELHVWFFGKSRGVFLHPTMLAVRIPHIFKLNRWMEECINILNADEYDALIDLSTKDTALSAILMQSNRINLRISIEKELGNEGADLLLGKWDGLLLEEQIAAIEYYLTQLSPSESEEKCTFS